MLIRPFSTRFLFLLVALVSLASLVLMYAMREVWWAIALCVAALSLLIAFVAYVVCFAAVGLVVEYSRERLPDAQSPFATEVPPKQVIPPVE